MGRPGPRLQPIELTRLERNELERVAADQAATERRRLRASIVLHAADGRSNSEIAERLDVTDKTVRAWRKRFLEHRLDGLGDAARTGAPKESLELSEEQREVLLRYVRRSKTSNRLASRARIILRCADGLTNAAVADELNSTPHTVGKWRRQFLAHGLDGLHDADRPGAPRQIGDDKVEEVVVRTLETMPKGASRWSTRLMAKCVFHAIVITGIAGT